MRPSLLLFLLVTACAQSGAYDQWKRQQEIAETGEKTLWVGGDHPFLYIYGGAGPTQFRYSDRAGRDEEVDAITYRGGAIGPTGFTIDATSTTEDMTGGTSAYTFDVFFFGNRILMPDPRVRSYIRPGVYYDRLNMKDALPTDAKPWTIGFRAEGEVEFDAIKAKTFNLSLFANGRIGGGWGRTTLGDDTVSSNSWGWGVEGGVRAQFHRFTASLSWMDRQTNLGGGSGLSGTEYGFRGATLLIGVRW